LDKFGLSLDDVISNIENHVPQKKAWTILTINLHALSILRKDKDFHKVYENTDKIIFDGNAAIWLAYFSGIHHIEKISTDFLLKALYELTQQKDWSLYFLGGPRGIAEKAANKITDCFPKVKIVGVHHGYFDAEEENEIIEEINTLSPDILTVGVGMPHEQKWIHKNKSRLKVGMITNCGAYIEQTANTGLDYYPDWAYKYKINWLYRIVHEPKKLWKRYLFEGVAFLPILSKAAARHFFKKEKGERLL